MYWNQKYWDDKKGRHLDQATHNAELYSIIENDLNPDFLDWAITVIFYACVHYVDARLAMHHVAVEDHDERKAGVSILMQDIWNEYNRAYKESRASRYDPGYRVNITIVKSYEYKMDAIRGSVPP